MVAPREVGATEQFSILARRSKPGGSPALYEAFAFREHDVAGVVGLLSPNIDVSPPSWAELEAQWNSAWGTWAGNDASYGFASALLAEVRIFTAYLASDQSKKGALGSQARGQVLRASAEKLAAGLGVPGGAGRLKDGVVLVGRWDEGRRSNRAAVLSEQWCGLELDRQVWPTYEGRLSPVLGYLLHAAKLHHASRTYATEYRSRFEVAREEVECQIDELSDVHRRLQGAHDLATRELVEVDNNLTRAVSANGGLLEQSGAVERLRLGAEIAWQNMVAFVPAATEEGHGSLFDFDRAEAEGLDRQIDFDLKYGHVARQRAEEGYRLTDLRLRQVRGEQADRQSNLTLVQTSVIGGLLAGLAAVSAVNFHVDLPMILQWAIIVTVGALGFSVPMLVTHNPQYERPDVIAAAFALGAIGWLALAAILHTFFSDVRLQWSLLGLALGFSAPIILSPFRSTNKANGSPG